MAYLIDTDAISELFKPRPASAYLEWLARVDREDQFTSAVVVGELYKGAFRSQARERHLRNIEERVLPAVTVLPFDLPVARVFGELQADLEAQGTPLADADVQIGATALYFGLALVTGNLRHFGRIPGLRVDEILADARSQVRQRPRGEQAMSSTMVERVYSSSRRDQDPEVGSNVWVAVDWPGEDWDFRQATYLGDGKWQLDEGPILTSDGVRCVRHWSLSRDALLAQVGKRPASEPE